MGYNGSSKELNCCLCYNPELDKLIYESKNKLEELSGNMVKSLYYGYTCDKKAEEQIKILDNYIRVLEDENRKVVLGGKECLDCNNLQKLAEKVRKLTYVCDIDLRKDLTVDRSGVDAWLMEFPHCASYEKWERLAYRVCSAFSLEVFVEKIDCDVDLEVFSSEELCNLAFDISREQIPCDIMVALSVYSQACDLDFKINRTEEECKIDFKLLHNEVDCDLDFKAYQRLIDCNLSFDIIKTVYENGCSFTVGDPIELVSPLNSYTLDKFSFNDIPDVKKLQKMGVPLKNSKYAADSQKFVQRIKSDFK